MFMSDDKKKPAALILESMGSELEPKPTKDGDVVEADLGLQSAGEELMAAFESKSPMAIMDALKAAIEMYEASKGDEA